MAFWIQCLVFFILGGVFQEHIFPYINTHYPIQKCNQQHIPKISFSTFENTTLSNLCQSPKIATKSLDFIKFDLNAKDCSLITNFLELDNPVGYTYFKQDAEVSCSFHKKTKSWKCFIPNRSIVNSFYDLDEQAHLNCVDMMDASTCNIQGNIVSSVHRHMGLGFLSFVVHVVAFLGFLFFYADGLLNLGNRTNQPHLTIFLVQKLYFFVISGFFAYYFVDPYVYPIMILMFVCFLLLDHFFFNHLLLQDFVMKTANK